MIRSAESDFRNQVNTQMDSRHPILAMLPTYVADVLSRHRVGHDGRTAGSLIHGTHLAYQETFLKTYLHRVNFQQLSLEIQQVLHQHNASPCSLNTGDLQSEQMNWRETLGTSKYLQRDSQGSFQLGILCLMQKELIRKIAWSNSRGIKSHKFISINSLILPQFSVGKRFSRSTSVLVQAFARTTLWIREVEMVESVHDLKTWRSIKGLIPGF